MRLSNSLKRLTVNYMWFLRVSLVNSQSPFMPSRSKKKFRTDIRNYFFTQQVVNVWHRHVVEAETLGFSKPGLIRC